MIGAQKVEEIILFPVFKTNFRLVIKSKKHFVREVVEKLILKLTSASTGVEVEARAELGKIGW